MSKYGGVSVNLLRQLPKADGSGEKRELEEQCEKSYLIS
jgi:hypothetical protein